MRAFIAGVGVSLAVLSGAAEAATDFSNIVVFGDSLSDNGNIPKLFGINTPAPPYYNYHFSNGPVYAEYLNGLLGVPAANFSDYAIGGAEAGATNFAGLPNAGVVQEIGRYLATGAHPGAKDLVVLWAGANDYFATLPAIQALPASQQAAALQGQVMTTVGNIVTDITRLAQAGVKNFIVPNLPDLGLGPSYNTNPASVLLYGQAALAHNAELLSALASTGAQLHVNITIVDIGTLFNQVIANPTAFGVINTTQECLLNAACVAQKLPYLFWDGVHPTAQSHATLAQYFTSTITAPTAIGAEGELAVIGVQSTFDAITSRTQALRDGASGLVVAGIDGNGTGGGDGFANPDKPLAGFLTGSYGWGGRDDRPNATGFDYTAKNIYGGLDYRVSPNFILGALFGYGSTDGSLNGSMGEYDFDSYQGAVYATYFNGGFYATVGGTYVGTNWNKLDRNTAFFGEIAKAKTTGFAGGGKIETGYVFNVGGFNVGPVGEMRWARIGIDGYTENGAPGLNQVVGEQNFQTLIGAFGGQVSFTTDFGGFNMSPHLRLTYDHEFKDSNRTIDTQLASQPLAIVTTAIGDPSKDSVRIGGGLDLNFGSSLTAMFDFNATAARGDGNDYQAVAKLRYAF